MFDVPKGAELLIDGLMGIYVPKQFVSNYIPAEWHIKPEDAAILFAGPDMEQYWDAWDDVLSYAWCEKDGKVYNLWQDGDLWAYCPADQEGL